MTTRFALMATVLATLVLASLPRAARGQTLALSSGDNVTVSAAGTVGIYQGAAINNTTKAYGSNDDYTVQTSGTAAFTLGAGGSITNAVQFGDAAIYAGGSGPLIFTGGTVTASDQDSVALLAASGPITITGGVFTANGFDSQAISTSGSATVTVTGGSFSATGSYGTGLEVSGGTLDLFSLADAPFLINGVSTNNTTLPAGSSGTISGTLLNGDTLDTTFTTSGGLKLNVGTPPAVPEPTSLAILAVAAAGLSGLRRQRLPHSETCRPLR